MFESSCRYELQLFPFDVQDLHVNVTLNIPTIRAILSENLEFPSLMRYTNFQQAAVSVLGIPTRELLRSLNPPWAPASRELLLMAGG